MSAPIRRAAFAAITLGLVGCGAPPPPAAPVAKKAKVEAPAPRTDIRAFAFSEPGLMAYLKASELSDLPGYTDWLEVHPEAQRVNALFERLRAGCNLDPFAVVDEVLFTLVRERLLGAVRVRLGQDEVFSCLEKLVDGGERKTIANHPSLEAPDGSMVMTLVGDILLFGDEATVADRIRSHTAYDGRISAALPDLRNVVAYARVEGDGSTVEAVESRFTREDDDLELSVRLESPSPEDADWLMTALRGSLDGEVTALIDQVPEGSRLRATNVLAQARLERRVGQRVEIALPVDQLAETQVLLVALVDRLGDAMLRRQHLEEARMVLEVLAMRVAGHAEAQPRARFVASAPLTPKEPPRGDAIDDDLSPADWTHATWKTLGFEPPMALPHAYEIETSPDGRATTIRAVADLDGDGERSVLEIALAIEDDGVAVGELTSRGDRE